MFGVDVLKYYELSWLNNSGKPHIACLTVITPNGCLSNLETKAFKHYLNSCAMRIFTNTQQIMAEISTEIRKKLGDNFKLSLTEPSSFQHISWEHQHITNTLPHSQIICSSYNVRFICKDTLQPFHGYITLYGDSTLCLEQNLSALLLKFRCTKFNMQEYVTCLFAAIANHIQEVTISLHISRRGGFSFQYIRSTFCEDVEIFIRRTVNE